MAWLAITIENGEMVFESKPFREGDYWATFLSPPIELPKGSIEKLIGKTLTWEDEPVEIK